MNELLGWYNFTKPGTRESLALRDFASRTPSPKEAAITRCFGATSPSLANSKPLRNLVSTSPSHVMKPTFNQNSPISSPVEGSVDQDIDSSDSEAIKFVEDLNDPGTNVNASGNIACDSPSNLEDPSSDSSRDSISKSGKGYFN